jgi:ribosome modulation factor
VTDQESHKDDCPAAYQDGWDAAIEGWSGTEVPYPMDRLKERDAWLEGHGDALSLLIDFPDAEARDGECEEVGCC